MYIEKNFLIKSILFFQLTTRIKAQTEVSLCPVLYSTSNFTLKLSVYLLKYSHLDLIVFRLQFKKVGMTTKCHVKTMKLNKINLPYCSTPWLCSVVIIKNNNNKLLQFNFILQKNIFFFILTYLYILYFHWLQVVNSYVQIAFIMWIKLFLFFEIMQKSL